MKRTLIASTLLALSAALLPAGADLASSTPTVSGTIVVPVGAARVQRCVHGSVANGTFGWVMNVTGGRNFTLTTGAPTIDDVNIGFYTSLSPCQGAANVAGNYLNSFGNESGQVPLSATKAIVYTGSIPVFPEHLGYARANVAFTYTETLP
jgi:hypothetical protein